MCSASCKFISKYAFAITSPSSIVRNGRPKTGSTTDRNCCNRNPLRSTSRSRPSVCAGARNSKITNEEIKNESFIENMVFELRDFSICA